MTARLTIHPPFQPSRVLVARPGREYLIGRDPECDLRLDDERISRRHASLRRGEGGWRLVDLESKNGIAVNGMSTRDAALGDGSWISFGGLPGRFETLSEERLEEESRRRVARLQTSLEIQRGIAPGADLDDLLRRVLDSALSLSGAERGFVLLSRADGELEVLARSGISLEELEAAEFSGSVGAIRRCLDTRKPVAIANVGDDTHLAARMSVVDRGILGLAAVPLQVAGRLLGAIYIDSRKPGLAFDELEVEILGALASHAGLAIAVTGLERELKGLAARLPTQIAAGETAASLEREIGSVWERSLPDYREARARPGGGSTWGGVLAAHHARAETGS